MRDPEFPPGGLPFRRVVLAAQFCDTTGISQEDVERLGRESDSVEVAYDANGKFIAVLFDSLPDKRSLDVMGIGSNSTYSPNIFGDPEDPDDNSSTPPEGGPTWTLGWD
jgi:hypothetical protein